MPDIVQSWAKAVLPDTFRCLGRDLVPLTVMHVLALERLGNVAWTGEREPTAEELAVAVVVCSTPADRVVRVVQASRWWWTPRLLWLGLRASWDLRSRLVWVAYLTANLTGPRRWRAAGDGALVPRSASTWMILVADLMREFGWSRQAAMQTPIAEGIWWEAESDDKHGTARFVTDADAELAGLSEPVEFVPDPAWLAARGAAPRN